MTIDATAPQPSSDVAGRTSAGQSTGEAATRAIPSAKLLHGQSSVTIDHDGTHYVLRATRAGKLILTK